MSRSIIDGTDSRQAGWDTEETSDAKEEVYDLLDDIAGAHTDLFHWSSPARDDEDTVLITDLIGTADLIVETLVDLGWRPTREGADDARGSAS